MKKIIIPIGFLLMGAVKAQVSGTENYIQSKTYLDYSGTTPTKTSETVQYFDGLGRPKQVVNVKASPQGKDVVTHIEYDPFGRQIKDYLPIPQGGTLNGAIVPNPENNASSIYGGEKIYSEKRLESSPLNRIQEQVQVGNDWSTKPVKFEYAAVTAADEVRKFTTVTTWQNGATQSMPGENLLYTDGQLYKNTVIDEDGNKTIEFKNGKGQTIMVRKEDGSSTYYVYNEYNQLAFVIPPLASVSTSLDQATLDNLCYQYRYDGRGRLVEKKLPGKGWEYMVYDKQDRLILTRDPLMEAKGQWLFTKYDKYGRVAYTGILSGAGREQMQNQIGGLSIVEEQAVSGISKPGILLYYTNNFFPDFQSVLTINYYDTYPRDTRKFPSPSILGQPVIYHDTGVSTQGMPTASYVKNIEDDNWTKTYFYYDFRGRQVGSHSVNHLGGYTDTESQLDFSGAPKLTVTRHKRLDTDVERIITETFEYDHQNRLLTHKHQVDSNPVEILAQNKYNELSQLESKKVGGADIANPLQTLEYKYNIRGWLTKINDPANLNGKLFGYEIRYNNPIYSNLTSGRFNGNIAEIDWKTANDGLLKRYSYSYDALNRLTKGTYSEPLSSVPQNNFFNEELSYDLNGNILNLKRNAQNTTTTAHMIDNLNYTYTGNRLNSVTDASQNYLGYPDTSGNPIQYDLNGNMTLHKDKGILGVEYNHLNLPSHLLYDKGLSTRLGVIRENTSYVYRADGVKVGKVYKYAPFDPLGVITKLSEKITDYLDGFQYEGAVGKEGGLIPFGLKFVPTAEGYYNFENNKYIYNYIDHLGNVRLSYMKNANGSGTEVIEENNYYPFGLKHEGVNILNGNPAYNYKYNGKELQTENGMYDYGARFYMPDIGRWSVVDPLAEQYRRWSPYNYAMNNPILFIDPDGRGTESTHTDKFGNVVAVYNDGDLGVYRHDGNTKETQQELNQNYSKENTSGGGERMGRTLVWNSFTEFDKRGKTQPAGKINFGSFQARDWLNNFSNDVSKDTEANGGFVARMNYAWNGGGGDKYDYKTQNGGGLYAGSQIADGVYVSARDVGNFAAGRAAAITGQNKMDFMLNAGGFNISGNSKMGLIFNNSHWKREAQKAGFPEYGEHFNSNLFQRLGYENVTTAEGIIKKSKIIWGDRK